MSVLLHADTRVIVQGITGKIGSFHAEEMLAYGTKVIGGVTPGKGGTTHLGLPVFNSVRDAVRDTGASASIVFVPPPLRRHSIMEAADAGIRLCVAITDGIPAQDMIWVKRPCAATAENRMRSSVPTVPASSARQGAARHHARPHHKPGAVGIVGRSGTLGRAAAQMQALGSASPPRSASAAIPSTAAPSRTFSNSSRKIRRPRPS
jgi:malate-CoA ligase subunit alpha